MQSFTADYLVWDNPEVVTFEHTRRAVSNVDGAPTPILDARNPDAATFRPPPFFPPVPPPTIDYVSVAKRRAITTRERIASAGAYLGSDVNWHLPSPVLPLDFSAKPSDVVVDAANARWTVLDVANNRLRLTWKLTCRNLALVFGLRDEIQIERAQISYDHAGAAVKTFPPAGGLILYGRLQARMQPQQSEITDERGIRGFRTVYDCIVGREVSVGCDDRILWNGVYLEITGYRQAERIDELPIITANLSS